MSRRRVFDAKTRQVKMLRAESVDRYFKEIECHELLDADEELACAIAMKSGDKQAREDFILANLRLVVKIAHDFYSESLPLEDRISEGNLGLIDAVDRYEPQRALRFVTYASYWIKHRICLAMCRTARAYRLPPAVYSKLMRYRGVLERLHRQGNHDPNDAQLAAALVCNVEQVAKFRTLDDASEVSIDGGITDESALHQRIDENVLDPSTAAQLSQARNMLSSAYLTLPERIRFVMESSYPLDGGPAKKFSVIADELNCSAESIRQYHKRGLTALQVWLEEERGITLMGDLITPGA